LGLGDPVQEEDLLEFRLLYEGEVLPSGNKNTRSPEKHIIRRGLHPQLRRLWAINPALRQLAATLGNQYDPINLATEEERFEHGISSIGKKWSMFGYEFVPMVTAEHAVRCSIDILLLRPEGKEYLFDQGDIDGQVKTLVDALRLPKSPEQLRGTGPQADETPFFCLLEDDKIISEIRINTDQLLLLPNKPNVKAHDCFVLIKVLLNYKSGRTFDAYFA
jgi:hypothetical protein